MKYVLDASAVLALLNGEAGAEHVIDKLADAGMSTVNAIEVSSKLIDKGMTPELAWEALDLLEIPLHDLDVALARAAAALRNPTKSRGLSLADRACLALADREGAPALTADRKWADLDLPCPVEFIR